MSFYNYHDTFTAYFKQCVRSNLMYGYCDNTCQSRYIFSKNDILSQNSILYSLCCAIVLYKKVNYKVTLTFICYN